MFKLFNRQSLLVIVWRFPFTIRMSTFSLGIDTGVRTYSHALRGNTIWDALRSTRRGAS
ncbi:MAG: hypothetical protein V9G20_29650 [Candidatus Promineifilaceae bacterium]